MIEQERRRLGQRLDDVARMCEGGMPPANFYSELLQRLMESLAAVAGCVWLKTAQGNLQQQVQINFQNLGINSSEEAKSCHDALLGWAFSTNQDQVQLPPQSVIGQPQQGRAAPGNPTDAILLIVPIRHNNQAVGLLEIFQAKNRPANAIPGFLQYMTLMAELAGRFQRNQLVGELSNQQTLWTQLENFSRVIHGSLNPTEVAFIVANEGRRLVECDRLSVAIRRGGEKTRIEACSGTDVVEHRSNLIRCMKNLTHEVMEWGEKLVFAGEKDDTLPPKVLKALDEYLQESPCRLLVIKPLRDEREGDGKDKPKLPPRSALIMECYEAQADEPQVEARLEIVSKHASSALFNAIEHRRIPGRWIWLPLAKLQEGLGGKTKAIVLAVVAAVSLLGAGLYAFPYPLKMEATGKALPQVRRWVYPPSSGILNRFEVKPNDVVGEGAVLALLFDRDLDGKMAQFNAEISAATHQIEAAVNQLRQMTDEREKTRVRSEEAQARNMRESKKKQLDKLKVLTNAIDDPQGTNNFRLLAPQMNANETPLLPNRRWTVLSGNFKDLERKEVRPTDQILRLGAKDGPWELEIKIPQKHIGQVLRGYQRLGTDELDVDFILTSDPTSLYRGRLARDRIAGETTPNQNDAGESEPYVLAFVRIEGDGIPEASKVDRATLTSDTDVRAKILCGPERAGYSLFYGVWEFLYEKVVFFLF
jgi:hypothetical protein